LLLNTMSNILGHGQEIVKEGSLYMKHTGNDSILGIVFKNIFTYFNLIFATIAILLICVGSYKSLTFLPVVIANSCIGIIQQIRAKKVLDRLTLISEANYKIIRCGEKLEVPSNQLQVGDIIELSSGQQIPSDATVIEGKIAVNESLLTGESDEIEKISGKELMSGSFVVSGNCNARLTKTGDDAYISQLSKKAKEIKEKPSEMVGDIDKIVKIAGIVIIPIGLLLLYQSIVVNNQSITTGIVSMVGAIIGMIPEGLYLLVTVALALSAMRLAKQNVLLHDMRSIETLARVDVLCVDKTGTITTNKMRVTKLFTSVGSENNLKENEDLLASYISTVPDNNITACAIRDYYPCGQYMDNVEVKPFSSKLKYSEIQTKDYIYRFGAPSFVLSKDVLDSNNEEIENILKRRASFSY